MLKGHRCRVSKALPKVRRHWSAAVGGGAEKVVRGGGGAFMAGRGEPRHPHGERQFWPAVPGAHGRGVSRVRGSDEGAGSLRMTPNSPPAPSGPLSRLRERAGERVADINTAPGSNLAPLFTNGVPSGRHDVASKSPPLPNPLPSGRGDRWARLGILELAGSSGGFQLKPFPLSARTSPLSLRERVGVRATDFADTPSLNLRLPANHGDGYRFAQPILRRYFPSSCRSGPCPRFARRARSYRPAR